MDKAAGGTIGTRKGRTALAIKSVLSPLVGDWWGQNIHMQLHIVLRKKYFKIKDIRDWLSDFNGMSTFLGLFYA